MTGHFCFQACKSRNIKDTLFFSVLKVKGCDRVCRWVKKQVLVLFKLQAVVILFSWRFTASVSSCKFCTVSLTLGSTVAWWLALVPLQLEGLNPPWLFWRFSTCLCGFSLSVLALGLDPVQVPRVHLHWLAYTLELHLSNFLYRWCPDLLEMDQVLWFAAGSLVPVGCSCVCWWHLSGKP